VRDDVRFERSRLLPHFFGHARVMRYHSLALVDPLPPCLRAIARTADGTVMALEHTTLPMLGLQFHPDSFATSSGEAMIRDFVRAALRTGDEAQP
jgi:para-aminobenzoate synthetase